MFYNVQTTNLTFVGENGIHKKQLQHYVIPNTVGY